MKERETIVQAWDGGGEGRARPQDKVKDGVVTSGWGYRPKVESG